MAVEYFTIVTIRAQRADGELTATRSTVYRVSREMGGQDLYRKVFTDACDYVDELDQSKVAVLFYYAVKNRLR